MKNIIVVAVLLCLTFAASQLDAQTVNNRDWKTFIADPLNDTLTFHFRSDTSFVTNSSGATILQTNTTISGDTLTLSDYGAGNYTCPGALGKYKISLSGNMFSLALIDDPCDGRAHALDGIKWTEVMK